MNTIPEGTRPTTSPDYDLSNAHRLVRALSKSPRKLDVQEGHRARALSILHALTSEAISRGWKVVPPVQNAGRDHTQNPTTYAPPGKNLFAVDAGSSPVNIRIRMQFRKEPHTLTPKEESDKAKGRSWGIPNWDFIPTDKIQLEVRADPYSPTVLRDGPRKSIEEGLPRALQKIEDATTKADEKRGRAEQAAIERERNQKEQEELERLTRRYESWATPLETFALDLSRHQEVAAAVEALDAYAKSLPEGSGRRKSFETYLIWAHAYVEATNPAQRFIPPAEETPRLAHESWRRSLASSRGMMRRSW